MPLFTIRIVQREDRISKKQLCPLYICVTVQRKRTYHSLGISVTKDEWDDAKSQIKGSVTNAATLNMRITSELTRIQRELLTAVDNETLNANTGKAATRRKKDFYEYAESIAAALRAKGQEETARRQLNNLPSIKAYAGEKLEIAHINKAWLKGYQSFCEKEPLADRSSKKKTAADSDKKPAADKKPKKAAAPNTVWSRFKYLRSLLLAAVEDKYIEVCPIGKKRGGYPMPKYEEVFKDYLTFEEVDKFVALLGSPGLSANDDLVLSFFLVECTAGIRHSDWSRFRIEKLIHNDALKVGETKKTAEPVYVPIGAGTRLEKVLNHIKNNGLVYTAKESAAANRTLKILSKVAGIGKPITTHTGRHTCGTLFLEKGYSRESVAEILGVTLRVVDTYAKMTRQKVRNEFDKLGGL
jgi:integrase